MNRAVSSKTMSPKLANESDAALDQLLNQHLNAPDEQLAPSSGFALSVMETIQQQATEPPPIPFPWRRVLPGAIAILCALAAFVLFVSGGSAASGNINMDIISAAKLTSGEIVLCGAMFAIVASVAVVAASFRLAGRNR